MHHLGPIYLKIRSKRKENGRIVKSKGFCVIQRDKDGLEVIQERVSKIYTFIAYDLTEMGLAFYLKRWCKKYVLKQEKGKE